MFSTIILAAAKAVGVPGALLLAICTHESGLRNVEAPHDHGSPSYGLCQVKEDTAKILGYTGDGHGLMNPETTAKYASLYLKYQLDRYQGDWLMATSAYNAGSYSESTRHPGYPKNIKYINKIRKLLPEDYKLLLNVVAIYAEK